MLNGKNILVYKHNSFIIPIYVNSKAEESCGGLNMDCFTVFIADCDYIRITGLRSQLVVMMKHENSALRY